MDSKRKSMGFMPCLKMTKISQGSSGLRASANRCLYSIEQRAMSQGKNTSPAPRSSLYPLQSPCHQLLPSRGNLGLELLDFTIIVKHNALGDIVVSVLEHQAATSIFF